MCFDATGSVVRRAKRPTEKSGHIFLYQGILCKNILYQSVPVVQMLSEKHDMNAIAYWLTEWMRAGAPCPQEAVSDFSLAFLGAMVKAFTPHPDLKSYINACFDALLKKPNAKMPPCFIRVDVAHLVKMVCQWDCLKKKPHRIKDFFVRSMAQVVMSQSFEDAEEILRAIIVVALSETEGSDNSGAPVSAETSKNYLKARISGEESILPDDEQEKGSVDECDDLQTDLREWVAQLHEESKALTTTEGDRDNMHFPLKLFLTLSGFHVTCPSGLQSWSHCLEVQT